jgi:hypothetical protein
MGPPLPPALSLAAWLHGETRHAPPVAVGPVPPLPDPLVDQPSPLATPSPSPSPSPHASPSPSPHSSRGASPVPPEQGSSTQNTRRRARKKQCLERTALLNSFADIAAWALQLAANAPDVRTLNLRALKGNWWSEGSVIEEHDDEPLLRPPPDLNATLAAFLPPQPAAHAALTAQLTAAATDPAGANLWVTRAGWRRGGAYGHVITEYAGVQLPPAPTTVDFTSYYGPLIATDSDDAAEQASLLWSPPIPPP